MKQSNEIQQISIALSAEKGGPVRATDLSLEQLQEQLATFRRALTNKNEGLLPEYIRDRLSPFNICVSHQFADRVKQLHESLDKAIIDIIDRWFDDTKADFPARMPLEKHEEDLLRWMNGPGREAVPKFADKYGMWRSDYLIERNQEELESAKVCEINARFPYNGFWPIGLHERGSRTVAGEQCKYKFPNDFELTKKVIFDSFNSTKPLFHICEKWKGPDQDPLLCEWKRRTGQEAIKIKPSELRLEDDTLKYCAEPQVNEAQTETNGGNGGPRPIEQCSLELFQDEYAQLDPAVLQKIATCCVSDLRTVFITHDKRLLGIIEQELPDLVERGVLTADERQALENGIAHTILAGSNEMQQILKLSKSDEKLRGKYIVKAVRDGFGTGIQMGKGLSQEEWLKLLESQAVKALLPSEGTVVVQKLVDHVWYDIVRHDGDDAGQPKLLHLIGSYHMINGKLGVYGPWRVGEELHVGLRGPGDLVSSTIIRQ